MTGFQTSWQQISQEIFQRPNSNDQSYYCTFSSLDEVGYNDWASLINVSRFFKYLSIIPPSISTIESASHSEDHRAILTRFLQWACRRWRETTGQCGAISNTKVTESSAEPTALSFSVKTSGGAWTVFSPDVFGPLFLFHFLVYFSREVILSHSSKSLKTFPVLRSLFPGRVAQLK